MLASVPSQHLESDYRPRRNPKCESTSKNHALIGWSFKEGANEAFPTVRVAPSLNDH